LLWWMIFKKCDVFESDCFFVICMISL
jgi:hypothetical protein